MSAPRSPRASTIQQQQPRQTVCWSNAGLPDANDAKNGGGSGGPETDERDSDTPQIHTSRLGRLNATALRQNLRCAKRRLLQQILVKLNHAEASDDAEYLSLRDRQTELFERVSALSTHIKSFATSLVALGHGSSLIGDASLQIAASRAQSMAFAMSGSGSNQQQQSELSRRASIGFGAPSFDSDFPKSMVKLESNARGLAGVLLTEVVGSLEKKLEAMTALKREMEERENFKLDYDSALRKLRAAKQRGKAEVIVRRDVKLQAARNTLTAATEAIVKKLLYYESARAVLVYHELRQFRELQTRFFTLCASSFEMREQLAFTS